VALTLELNVFKCKSITFLVLGHSVKFSCVILDHVDSISDLRVIVDSRMSSAEHVNVTARMVLAMKFSSLIRTVTNLTQPRLCPCCVRLVTVWISGDILYWGFWKECEMSSGALEYASCVWRPFYDVHVSRIERVQKYFSRYALRRLSWTNMHSLPLYLNRCTLIPHNTLCSWRFSSTGLINVLLINVQSTRSHNFFNRLR
jgi:hypothetical protein